MRTVRVPSMLVNAAITFEENKLYSKIRIIYKHIDYQKKKDISPKFLVESSLVSEPYFVFVFKGNLHCSPKKYYAHWFLLHSIIFVSIWDRYDQIIVLLSR